MTLIFEPEYYHHCVLEVERAIQPTPAPGAVARCACGRYLILDQRTGRWTRIPKWAREVREAIAHHEERWHGGDR